MSDSNVILLFAPIEKLSELTGRALPELKAWVRVSEGKGTFNVPKNTRAKPVQYQTRAFLAWHRNLTLKCGLPLPQPLSA